MDAYIGEIRIFAGTYAPTGWSLCNGQSLVVSENQSLFALIGTTYGGDGVNTFALPNLSGRVPMGQGQIQDSKVTYKMGDKGGTNTVTLTAANYPAHTHAVMATTITATTAVPGPTLSLANLPSLDVSYSDSVKATGKFLDFGASAVSFGGGVKTNQQAINNTMPTVPLNYIICVTGGLFPQQAT